VAIYKMIPNKFDASKALKSIGKISPKNFRNLFLVFAICCLAINEKDFFGLSSLV
jgi:hypothetical protein